MAIRLQKSDREKAPEKGGPACGAEPRRLSKLQVPARAFHKGDPEFSRGFPAGLESGDGGPLFILFLLYQ